ncbi:MAG: VOC family protein [Pseudomonadota bacterium]
MKRLHIHLNAEEAKFAASVDFYTNIFGEPPTKTRDGYVKWMLDEPAMNFALESDRISCGGLGIDHVGFEVTHEEELAELRERLQEEAEPVLGGGETVCCYAKSDKTWTADPTGVRWEMFRSFGDTDEYGRTTDSENACKAG